MISLALRGKSNQNRGPGLWKLGNEEFIRKTKELIRPFKEKYINLNDLQLKWHTINCKLRGFIVKYLELKARENMKLEELLLKELDKQNEKKIVC